MFFNFIKKFDVIFLLETHLEQKDLYLYEHLFKDFHISFVAASRYFKYGRAVGGCIYGYKKNKSIASICSFIQINNNFCIRINQKDDHILLIPTYINCTNWASDFEQLNCLLNEINDSKCIIMGDCNARIGDAQIIQSGIAYFNTNVSLERKSKDKCINARGKQWLELCDNNDLVVLNGRVEGDREGNFSFISSWASSVLDLCCVNFSLLSAISKFTVIPEVFSDHCPIVLNIKLLTKVVNNVSAIPLLPKLVWLNDSEKYKSNLDYQLSVHGNSDGDSQTELATLVNMIKQASGVQKSLQKPLNRKQEWFDWQCVKERNKTFRLLNIYRKSNSLVIRRNYLTCKQKYKQLCKAKKEEFANSLIDKISAARDSKDFWNIIKKYKKQSFMCNDSLGICQFKEYFEKLYNPSVEQIVIMYAEPYLCDVTLDNKFSLQELKLVLDKAKCGKAPGLNRVPYEFFKNASSNFLLRLLALFNKI